MSAGDHWYATTQAVISTGPQSFKYMKGQSPEEQYKIFLAGGEFNEQQESKGDKRGDNSGGRVDSIDKQGIQKAANSPKKAKRRANKGRRIEENKEMLRKLNSGNL